MLSTQLYLLKKNKSWGCLFLFCSYKNVFYKVNTSLAGSMNIDSGKQEPTHGFTEICSLPAFLCLFIYRFVLSLTLCCHLYEIPGLGQGWRCRGIVLWFCGCTLLKTEEHVWSGASQGKIHFVQGKGERAHEVIALTYTACCAIYRHRMRYFLPATPSATLVMDDCGEGFGNCYNYKDIY